jgi:hypothetical protein
VTSEQASRINPSAEGSCLDLWKWRQHVLRRKDGSAVAQSLKLAPHLVTNLDNAQGFFGPIAEKPCLSELPQAWYVQTCPEIVGTEEEKKTFPIRGPVAMPSLRNAHSLDQPLLDNVTIASFHFGSASVEEQTDL